MSKVKRGRAIDKIQGGDVIGDTFEFFDTNKMEIVTLKTVPSSQRGFSGRCPSECHFRTLQSETDDFEKGCKEAVKRAVIRPRVIQKAAAMRFNRSRNHVCASGVWPCAIHSCLSYSAKRLRKNDGSLSTRNCNLGPVHYELVSSEKVTQEKEDEV